MDRVGVQEGVGRLAGCSQSEPCVDAQLSYSGVSSSGLRETLAQSVAMRWRCPAIEVFASLCLQRRPVPARWQGSRIVSADTSTGLLARLHGARRIEKEGLPNASRLALRKSRRMTPGSA